MIKTTKVSGVVVDGKKLGRKLGYPTANIEIESTYGIKCGVWLVRVKVNGKSYYGVANIGTRPTTDNDSKPILEVYIFEFSADIYGCSIEVEFVSFLRTEKRYNTTEELKEAIDNDVKDALDIINNI